MTLIMNDKYKRIIEMSALPLMLLFLSTVVWGIERSGFFNDRGKWVKSFENQRV